MNIVNEQAVLENSERDFLWALANNKDEAALNLIDKISEFKNITKYAIDNRIEHKLYKFLFDFDLLNKIEERNIGQINQSIEAKAKKSLITYQKALKILNEFTNNEINYVSLKGISFLEYSKTFDRPIRDIDVLVDHNDIERAVKIAFKHGFRFKNHDKFSKNMIMNNSDIYDLPDLIDENNVCLEIHYKILRESNQLSCKLSKNLLSNVKSFSIHGNVIKTSSLNSCISHLIYHSSKKGCFDIGIGSIFDLKFLSNFLKKNDYIEIQNISDECGYGYEARAFLNVIQEKSKAIDDGNADLLRELIFSPNINIKVQEFFLEKSLLQNLKKILKLLFVKEDHIRREFKPESTFFITRYFDRWVRQFSQYGNYVYLVIFKREMFKKRAKLIKKFYNV